MKTFFKTISPYISDKKFSNGTRIILRENDEIISEPIDVAKVFNAYYSSIANYIGVNDGIDDLTYDQIMQKHANHSSVKIINDTIKSPQVFNFNEINADTITKYINDLNANKSAGYDGLKPYFVKVSKTVISSSICEIFNKCIRCDSFPSQMKLSEISPIFKKNDNLNKENYRSVNLLPVLSKVFERILADQIMDFFKTILSPHISAYRKGYSCQHVIIKLTEFWRSALDNNECVGTLSTDLSKAFDKMPHGLLVAKLHAYGFSSSACGLVMNYLCNRMQRVKISGSFSEWTFINRGVPQGSVLGPLLFNIFINDLFYVNLVGNIANYADDNNLYSSDSCLYSLQCALTEDATKTISWYKDNNLEANADKFQYLVMGRKGKIDMSIPVNDNSIESMENINILGVNLDSKLNFDAHVKSICARASYQINALRRISKFINIDSRLKIYKAFIRAHFSYCPVVLGFCGKQNAAKLEKLQERALRFVYGDYKTTYSKLLSEANVLSLSMHRLRFMAIEMYKCVNHLNPAFLNDMFTLKPSKYNLRDGNIVNQPTFNTITYGYKSFSYYGAKLWNALPHEIKTADNLFQFKILLTEWCATDRASRLTLH